MRDKANSAVICIALFNVKFNVKIWQKVSYHRKVYLLHTKTYFQQKKSNSNI